MSFVSLLCVFLFSSVEISYLNRTNYGRNMNKILNKRNYWIISNHKFILQVSSLILTNFTNFVSKYKRKDRSKVIR